MHCNTLLTASIFIATALGAAVSDNKTTSTKVTLTEMGIKSARVVPTTRSISTQNLPPLTVTTTTRSTAKVTPEKSVNTLQGV
jgi:hypothetical protein